jgi:HAMP domain-containing protein
MYSQKERSVSLMITKQDPWVYRLLGEQNFQSQKGFLPWWYRLTSPPDPGPTATLKQRDVARRSKILSALALFLALTLIMVAYVALSGPNKQIIVTVEILYPTILICLVLNRFRHVNLAGLVLTIALVGGMYLTLVTTAFFRGGLTPNDKDILYLPFFAELVAAALLPTIAIFVVAAFNISFSLWILNYAPHTPAFSQMLLAGSSSITFRIVEIHFFVALVLWIVSTWTLISVKQANRASELARLEHDLNAAANEKVREKEKLDLSINEIVRVHMEVANGRLTARVPLKGENVLVQIAGPLNHLLSRYQQALKEAQEREMLAQVLGRLVQQYPQIREATNTYLHEQRLPQQGKAPSTHASQS